MVSTLPCAMRSRFLSYSFGGAGYFSASGWARAVSGQARTAHATRVTGGFSRCILQGGRGIPNRCHSRGFRPETYHDGEWDASEKRMSGADVAAKVWEVRFDEPSAAPRPAMAFGVVQASRGNRLVHHAGGETASARSGVGRLCFRMNVYHSDLAAGSQVSGRSRR